MKTKTVLIFGSQGGLGSALKNVYENENFHVITSSRDNIDLLDRQTISEGLNKILQNVSNVDICIFAAGISEAGKINDLPVESFQRCFQVNFMAPLQILSYFKARTERMKFLFVLSGAADIDFPGLAPYSLSKRALRDFIRYSQMEGDHKYFQLIPVYPGGIQTKFDAKTKLHGRYVLPSNPKALTPEAVAQWIFKAEQQGKKKIIISRTSGFLGKLQILFPSWINFFLKLKYNQYFS